MLRLSKECYATVKAAGKKGAPDALQKWGYRTARGYGFGSNVQESMGDAYDDARQIVGDVCNLHYRHATAKPIHFRTPTVADVTKFLGERATNRTTTFRVGWEATITFKGNEVTWNVPENNHACDHAHEHHIGRAFFAALNKVTWTRGSGGVIVGNNEYSRDSYDVGGGGNYETARFGPQTKRPTRSVASLYR